MSIGEISGYHGPYGQVYVSVLSTNYLYTHSVDLGLEEVSELFSLRKINVAQPRKIKTENPGENFGHVRLTG